MGSSTTNSKTTIGIRVPEDLEERFEEYREKHSLSKSDAGRKLLRQSLNAETQEEGTRGASNDENGYSDWIFYSLLGGFIAVSVFQYFSGYRVASLVALSLAGLGGLADRSYAKPYDARSRFLYGYVTLFAASIFFGVLYFAGKILIAGAVEVSGFLLAFIIWSSHVHSEGLSEFARGRASEAFLIFSGGICIIFRVAGAPRVVADTGVLAILLGITGMTLAVFSILTEAVRTSDPEENATSEPTR